MATAIDIHQVKTRDGSLCMYATSGAVLAGAARPVLLMILGASLWGLGRGAAGASGQPVDAEDGGVGRWGEPGTGCRAFCKRRR